MQKSCSVSVCTHFLAFVQEPKTDDSAYSLFSDELRDEREEPPLKPRRSGCITVFTPRAF